MRGFFVALLAPVAIGAALVTAGTAQAKPASAQQVLDDCHKRPGCHGMKDNDGSAFICQKAGCFYCPPPDFNCENVSAIKTRGPKLTPQEVFQLKPHAKK